MPNSGEQSPDDDYFNDLSQQPTRQSDGDPQRRTSQEEGANDQLPKTKRIACVLCRKRKLKCDGNKPSCGTCNRLQHDCSYDEVRRKSGPKRGYVKALEARLAQVETLLVKQDDQPAQTAKPAKSAPRVSEVPVDGDMVPEFPNIVLGGQNVEMMPLGCNEFGPTAQTQYEPLLGNGFDNGMPGDDPFPWEMIGLGLDEPLPPQDSINELNRAYFDKVHPSLPMVHAPRYHAAMNLAPHMRPPVCLRYAMWANAAAASDTFDQLHEHFYHRARKYLQQDEMKGHGEAMVTIAHCQTWILCATYEFKMMYFPRAWMSSGRASRMTQMMGLHRIDGAGLDVKQCLPPPKDWTDQEERRRTFWAAFCIDRYSSIGTGWPMTLEEVDIMTNLPGSEDDYELNRAAKTLSLHEALTISDVSSISGYSGVILMATLFGRNLTHLHRPSVDDADDDLNGAFWKRHREMDNVLLETSLTLPDRLRLPSGLNDPNVIFLNMCIHTSTICLHQAAIFKADKNRMPARISAESKVRCITAAAEIASIMRQISHMDLSAMNPFISFCLYVAARVFVQYLKSRPKDEQIKASLTFLLTAMQAVKRKNPLTESFLIQLGVDLEGAGIDTTSFQRTPWASREAPKCPLEAGGGRPTYGDNGLATFTDPMRGTHDAAFNTQRGGTYGLATDQISGAFGASLNQRFELPNRQRGSPQSFQMDTSPDASNGSATGSGTGSGTGSYSNDQRTPNSSNTGYTPPSASLDPAIFTSAETVNGNNTFAGNVGDFDLSSFSSTTQQQPQQQQQLSSSDWPSLAHASGLLSFDSDEARQQQASAALTNAANTTTGTTMGFVPEAEAGQGEENSMLNTTMGIGMGMSDAEWSAMMESMAFTPGDGSAGVWDLGTGQGAREVGAGAESSR